MEATMVSRSSNTKNRTLDLFDRIEKQAFSNQDDQGSSSSLTAVPMMSELSLMGSKVMEGRASRKAMREEEKKAFPCNYCQRKFPSPQALGGHQKMHKGERSLIKLNGGGRHHGGSTAGHITHEFFAVAGLYKPITSCPLGIQAQSSMVHRPHHRRQKWTWPARMNLMQQQEVISRLLEDHLYDGKEMPTLALDDQTTGYRLGDSGGAESFNGSIGLEYFTKDEPELDLTLRL